MFSTDGSKPKDQDFDMFTHSPSKLMANAKVKESAADAAALADNWDDAEGQ